MKALITAAIASLAFTLGETPAEAVTFNFIQDGWTCDGQVTGSFT